MEKKPHKLVLILLICNSVLTVIGVLVALIVWFLAVKFYRENIPLFIFAVVAVFNEVLIWRTYQNLRSALPINELVPIGILVLSLVMTLICVFPAINDILNIGDAGFIWNLVYILIALAYGFLAFKVFQLLNKKDDSNSEELEDLLT